MSVTLAKNPLFLMVDTETIYLKKRIYELAFMVFDSITCEVIDNKRFFIKETLESAAYYFLRHGKTPIFWPESRLNILECLKDKDTVTWQTAQDNLLLMLAKYDIKDIIAHNINFDLSAIYKTAELYSDDRDYAILLDKLPRYEKLELSGFFIHGLPSGLAYDIPFKMKSGCATFKADYLVPALVKGGSQNHDALGDCMNQLQLYKAAIANSGKYQNQGTIYGNMQMFHKVQYDNARRLGTSELD